MSAKETVRENSMKYKLKDGVLFYMVNKKSKMSLIPLDLVEKIEDSENKGGNNEK